MKYKIKTPYGWKQFDKVVKKGVNKTLKITLDNGNQICCTPDHMIYTNLFRSKKASELKVGDLVYTTEFDVPIVRIEDNGEQEVFDVLEVDGHNVFYANDVLVHNCEFIGQSNSLIDANVLRQLLLDLQDVTYKFVIDGDIRFYEDLKPNLKYIVGVDTSMGVDGDFSAIQVFSFPDMVQVAEWQSDRLNQNLQVEKLKTLTDWMYADIKAKGNKHPDIHWSLENNGSGEGFICALREKGDVHYINRASIINERGNKRIGFTTTRLTKPAACSQLKILVESNRLKIRSRQLAVQLSNFSAKSVTSYSANGEGHDDLVMATVVVIMQYLQEKNALDLNLEVYAYDDIKKQLHPDNVGEIPFIFNIH